LYARARLGEISGVVGVDLPIEEPLRPDLQIDNAEPRTEFGDIAETNLLDMNFGQSFEPSVIWVVLPPG